ncbi:DUF1835 domain-containing protein [Roseiarcaceae bacterium H3SJ34-1]|uniref:DUF1835 domain-containing protein n=1 Tax=Terripilifer ovatus TaxID=3032367 RepID=UPI003AB93578|nr:DUF1835 domain-containing protein [Roseiarcaceae bacterium H3SJ34-1]
MKTLHIAPGDSAGGSLQQAVIDAGTDDEVLPWRDDLSCGPISPGRRLNSMVAETMWLNSEPYYQVGDVMLLMRAVAPVEQGKLIADGDPWDMRSCRVRLPDSTNTAPASP